MCNNYSGHGFSGFGDNISFKFGRNSLLEILVLSKTTKFPFRPMDYSPWSSKNLIDRNRLKKFMQVGVDVKYMHTNFGRCGYFSFGDIATLKNG